MSILINSDDINKALKAAQKIPCPADEKAEYYYGLAVSECRRYLAKCPDSTPTPPPKYEGSWIPVITKSRKTGAEHKKKFCSRCGWSTSSLLQYCGRCGQKNEEIEDAEAITMEEYERDKNQYRLSRERSEE